MDEVEKIKQEKITFVDLPIRRSPDYQNEMGLFFCDVMMNLTKA